VEAVEGGWHVKVYIVQGSCGEYSDRREWSIKVYADQKRAEQHVLNAEKWSQEWYVTRPDYFERDLEKPESPYDPFFQHDYTGTRYWLDEVDAEL
jgi:hypothetical protein